MEFLLPSCPQRPTQRFEIGVHVSQFLVKIFFLVGKDRYGLVSKSLKNMYISLEY